MSDPKTLNAQRLHLVLLNVTTKAMHFKLEELIMERDPSNPNCIKEFLDQKYRDHRTSRELFLRPLLKKLNPNHPRGNANSPNQLVSFDISSCFQIAKTFLSLPNANPNLILFDRLREIRNLYYGHLNFLEIEDVDYNQVMSELEIIVEQLCPQKQLENKNEIDRIRNITNIDQEDVNELKEIILGLVLNNKDMFLKFNVLKEETKSFLDKYAQIKLAEENKIDRLEPINLDLNDVCRDLKRIIETSKKCSQDEITRITKAFCEQLQIEREMFELNFKKYLDNSFALVNQNTNDQGDLTRKCVEQNYDSLQTLMNDSQKSNGMYLFYLA